MLYRRILALTAAALLLLTACQSPAPQRQIDLDAVYQAIMDSQPKDAEPPVLFPERDPALIEAMYPGLSQLAVPKMAFYVAPVTGFACEIMLVEAADTQMAQDVADIFRARVSAGSADTNYPETAALWQQNARVQSEGPYVAMVVLPDGCTIPDDIFALVP
ncbi:MAG: DUF4358 domain-containing protein [Oscillospiraceae bacterium]|nr:DUF4358 domain-containing protein [Oscillospiraceae bacterium]